MKMHHSLNYLFMVILHSASNYIALNQFAYLKKREKNREKITYIKQYLQAKFLNQFPVKFLVIAISVISVCTIMFLYSSIIIFLEMGKTNNCLSSQITLAVLNLNRAKEKNYLPSITTGKFIKLYRKKKMFDKFLKKD